jgi:lysophospholipase L1-like esterase
MSRDTDDPRKSSPRRPGYMAILSIAASLVAGAVLLEGASRWLLDDGMNFDVEMWKYARDIKRVSANPEIGHEHRPGTSGFYMGVPVQINSTGLRDREFDMTGKSKGVVRTLMLGDSLTFGWGVRVEDTPSKLLESLLNAQHTSPQNEVINTGVGNYNTAMEVAYFFDRGMKFKPDVVVLNYFINDAEPQPHRHQAVLTEYSYAYVMFSSAIDKISREFFGKADWKTYYKNLYGSGEPGWNAAQAAIQRLAVYCRENHIKLLVVNYPELHQLRNYPFPEVTEAVAATVKRNDVDFLDLLPTIVDLDPASLWVSPTDAHPNRIANVRFAQAIGEKLTQDFPDIYEGTATSSVSDVGYQAHQSQNLTDGLLNPQGRVE